MSYTTPPFPTALNFWKITNAASAFTASLPLGPLGFNFSEPKALNPVKAADTLFLAHHLHFVIHSTNILERSSVPGLCGLDACTTVRSLMSGWSAPFAHSLFHPVRLERIPLAVGHRVHVRVEPHSSSLSPGNFTLLPPSRGAFPFLALLCLSQA